MDKVTREGLFGLALIGFVYILFTFVFPLGAVILLVAAAITKNVALAYWGLSVFFGPWLIAVLLGLFRSKKSQ